MTFRKSETLRVAGGQKGLVLSQHVSVKINGLL